MKYPEEYWTTKHVTLYAVWHNMLCRCRSDGRQRHRYFDRGITICEEWLYWPAFAKWALGNGWQRGLEIDRRDNDSGYRPDNCRFVDDFVQAQNRDAENHRHAVRRGHTKLYGKLFICRETGTRFETQQEAFRQTGVNRTSLRIALKHGGMAGGFHWEYITTTKQATNAFSASEGWTHEELLKRALAYWGRSPAPSPSREILLQ